MSEINIRDIQANLGLNITADFIINELMVEPVRTDKKAKFWTIEQGQKIKRLLVEHIEDAGDIEPGAGKPVPKPAKKKAPVQMDLDDDEI